MGLNRIVIWLSGGISFSELWRRANARNVSLLTHYGVQFNLYFQNILQIWKKYLESISNKQIACEKFVKSREQLQILVLFKDPQITFTKSKIFCHVTLAPVVSTLSHYSVSCRTRLPQVDLESLRKRTKLH